MTTENLSDGKYVTNAFVSVDGDATDFVSLSLEQSFGEHHRFRIVTDYDALKNDFLSNPLKQIALIGKKVLIELQQGNDSDSAYEFAGVIDNIVHEGRDGKHGFIVIEGASPTVLLERGKRLDIFTDMTLDRVFSEVTDGVADGAVYLSNHPAYTGKVPFLMQYRESDWEFLQRLSALSGETLFYTGREVVFGTYKDWSPAEVMYDREISDIRFGFRLLPNHLVNYLYLPGRDDTLEQESPRNIENSNEYLNAVAERSTDLIRTRPPRLPVDFPMEDKGALDDRVKRQKTATASQTIYIQGVSKTCAPLIGRLLKISVPENISDAGELGTYRVMKVKHVIDQNHRYRCEFEGIPANLKYFPTPELKMPVASSVLGKVIWNNDPDGLGRVRVEFPFARDRQNYTWLRVMSPDAGGLLETGNSAKGVVAENRGMLFVPEVGDQVMVGFEFGDPNRPYVMGSMFHGKNTTGGGEENHIKSITTRSGHTLEFEDNEASLGITLKDINGNEIHLDSKGKNIEITAPETINLNAKNINFNADENISMTSGTNTDIQAGNNLTLTIENEYQLIAAKSTSNIDEESALNAKKIEESAEKVTINSTKEDMDLTSTKKVNVQSSDKINLF
jgi:uncharacterized protein involved in type VI secretion and phage assembly